MDVDISRYTGVPCLVPTPLDTATPRVPSLSHTRVITRGIRYRSPGYPIAALPPLYPRYTGSRYLGLYRLIPGEPARGGHGREGRGIQTVGFMPPPSTVPYSIYFPNLHSMVLVYPPLGNTVLYRWVGVSHQYHPIPPVPPPVGYGTPAAAGNTIPIYGTPRYEGGGGGTRNLDPPVPPLRPYGPPGYTLTGVRVPYPLSPRTCPLGGDTPYTVGTSPPPLSPPGSPYWGYCFLTVVRVPEAVAGGTGGYTDLLTVQPLP